MDTYEQYQKEYNKKRIEHLKEEKPYERYKLIEAGAGSFLIHDHIAHRNYEQKCDYLLEPSIYGYENKPNPRYKNKEEFMELLNSLDRQVNGDLYTEEKQGLLISKKLIYDHINQKLDCILNNLTDHEEFTVSYGDNTHSEDPYLFDEILIDVHVYREGLKDLSYQKHELFNNPIFSNVFKTINEYQTELEKENRQSEVDALIELKMRLMENLELKNIFKEMIP